MRIVLWSEGFTRREKFYLIAKFIVIDVVYIIIFHKEYYSTVL